MTYLIHLESPFLGSSNWRKPSNTPFCTDVYRLLSNSSSSRAPWGKQPNSWTPLSIFLRPRIPSWIWIRYIQYATHRNKFTSPPKLVMSTAMPNLTPTPSDYFTSGQHFLETFSLLPETTRNTNQRRLQRLFPQTANMTFNTYGKHTSLARPTTCAAFSTIS